MAFAGATLGRGRNFSMKQPLAAPIAAGAGALGGIAGLVIGVFEIADCMRFQSRQGECSGVVSANAPLIVIGCASIAGVLGGLFTLNPALERRDSILEKGLAVTSAIGKVIDPEKIQFQHGFGKSVESIAELYGIPIERAKELLDETEEPGT